MKDIAVIKLRCPLDEGSKYPGIFAYSLKTGRAIVCGTKKRAVCDWLARNGYTARRRVWDWKDAVRLIDVELWSWVLGIAELERSKKET